MPEIPLSVACLQDIRPVKAWHNSAGPWCLVHEPTGTKIPTLRMLPDGTGYHAYAFKRKRDAQAALDQMLPTLRRQINAAGVSMRTA
jgi:hypothetical protein